MAQQKSRRWQETGSRDLFAEAGYLDFYRHLAQQGITGGEVIISGLQVKGQWIATHWGVRYDKRFYWLMPGYENDAWARYSPGRVLLDAVVQWSIEEKLSVFDLTVGDEGYKRQWADHVLPLYAGSYGVTLRGKLVVRLLHCYETTRARAREMTWLRYLVNRLRGRSSASK
jgi:CelD/BcsL family acetyltransferase involved in cellulose biosynthesis